MLTPLELGVERGTRCRDVGDFFCPISLERMCDIEKGEDWALVGSPLSKLLLPLVMCNFSHLSSQCGVVDSRVEG